MNYLLANWMSLVYLLRHKWAVMRYRHLTKCGFLRALIHDWTKFLPGEWWGFALGPRTERFYHYRHDGEEPEGEGEWREEFGRAWNLHQKRNPHHWQFWVFPLRGEKGGRRRVKLLPIPLPVLREMVLDWVAAECAQGKPLRGGRTLEEWWKKHEGRVLMHKESRRRVKRLIREVKERLKEEEDNERWKEIKSYKG